MSEDVCGQTRKGENGLASSWLALLSVDGSDKGVGASHVRVSVVFFRI